MIEISDNIHQNKSVKKKRYHLKRILFAIFIIAVIWWFNNYSLKATKIDLYYENINDDIKLVVISDQHAEKIGIANKTIINAIEKQQPDLIFVLGDMYSSTTKHVNIPTELMTDLVDDGYDVYFVPGEHDNDQFFIDTLTGIGVNVMSYKTTNILVKNTQINIYGIDNVYFSSTFDLTNEFELPDDDVFSILMAHIPNYEAYADFGADLTLCGDTHGNVVQLPFIGSLYDNGEYFPTILNPNKTIYDKGLFEYEDGNMFITSGVGNYPIPARLFNRPEIVCITLHPENNN